MGWEKWRLFLYVAASEYHVISMEVENCFKHNHIFRKCRYTLIDSFMFFFLFFAVILSELHEKPRRKYWVTEKTAWMNLSEQHHFLAGTPSSLCYFFFWFFVYSLPFCLLWIYVEKLFLLLKKILCVGERLGFSASSPLSSVSAALKY